MVMVDVDGSIQQAKSQPYCWLAWSKGWQPPGADYAFVK